MSIEKPLPPDEAALVCSYKQRFTDRNHALDVVARMRKYRKNKRGNSAGRLMVYTCEHCGLFHIGHSFDK